MMRWLVIGMATCLAAKSVSAQVVIQQPAVRVQGVNTAVSVPDRGSALLGSVSRGAEAGHDYGPVPYGTSTGRSYERAAQRVTVTIHDFEEMDQLLLNSAAARVLSGPTFPHAMPGIAPTTVRSKKNPRA